MQTKQQQKTARAKKRTQYPRIDPMLWHMAGRKPPRKALAAALALGLALGTAQAAEPSRWALDVNTTSVHTEAWARRDLNQDNPGLGLEYLVSPDWSGMAGFYRNSYRRTSAYMLGVWTPLHMALPAGLTASAGLAAGLVSGYTRNEVPTQPWAAGAVLRIRNAQGFGLNFLGVPNTQSGSGFIGVQAVIPID